MVGRAAAEIEFQSGGVAKPRHAKDHAEHESNNGSAGSFRGGSAAEAIACINGSAIHLHVETAQDI